MMYVTVNSSNNIAKVMSVYRTERLIDIGLAVYNRIWISRTALQTNTRAAIMWYSMAAGPNKVLPRIAAAFNRK